MTCVKLTSKKILWNDFVNISAFVSEVGNVEGALWSVFPQILFNLHVFVCLESVHTLLHVNTIPFNPHEIGKLDSFEILEGLSESLNKAGLKMGPL